MSFRVAGALRSTAVQSLPKRATRSTRRPSALQRPAEAAMASRVGTAAQANAPPAASRQAASTMRRRCEVGIRVAPWESNLDNKDYFYILYSLCGGEPGCTGA